MMIRARFAAPLLLGVFLFGCGDDAKSTAGSSSAATKTTASTKASSSAAAKPSASASSSAAAGKNPCTEKGMTGTGTFQDACKFKGPSPITAKFTGKYKKEFDKERPVFEVTNPFDFDLNWGNVAVYYYDKSGKQLEADVKGTKYKKYWASGGVFQLKAKETKEVMFGWAKDEAPKGTDAIEAEIQGYGWNDHEPQTFFEGDDIGKDDRAKGGGAAPAASGSASAGPATSGAPKTAPAPKGPPAPAPKK